MKQHLLLASLFAVASSPVLADEACEPLTGMQVAAGFVTWMNVMMVFAIGLGAACIGYLMFKMSSWLNTKTMVYVGMAVSLSMLGSAAFLEIHDEPWLTLGGSLLFGATFAVAHAVSDKKMGSAAFWGILFLLWSSAAILHHDAAIGFIAVVAFMAMIGFSAAVVPMGYLIGFRDEEALGRATSAGLLLVVFYAAIRAIQADWSYVSLFEAGALYLGSFVAFLSLLIRSSRWYDSDWPYAARQLVAVLAGLGAIAAGSLLGIPELLAIGGSFLALYLVTKPFDIPAASLTGYAAIGLCTSAAVGSAVWWSQNNMDSIRPYLLF